MRTASEQSKIQRLREIEDLLLHNRRGLLPAEIARQLNVHRSTIGRYLPDLPGYVAIDPLTGRWMLDRERFPVEVRLDRHEALALHLAARMLATRTDRRYPRAASAVSKIGNAIQRTAPLFGQHLLQSAAALTGETRRDDPDFLRHLETITTAWAEARLVQIEYRKSPASKPSTHTIAPAFIEPYPIGQTTYLIGRSMPAGKLITLKVERIENATLLDEPYTQDDDFDPHHLLEDAWSIWYTAAEPVEVRLRFLPDVAHRVVETRWHASQVLEPLPDGSLLWTAHVAEPTEMLPWVHGWGASVEVLAPESLRQHVADEARTLAAMYAGG